MKSTISTGLWDSAFSLWRPSLQFPPGFTKYTAGVLLSSFKSLTFTM